MIQKLLYGGDTNSESDQLGCAAESKISLIHVEDVWRDERILGTDLFGEFRHRLQIFQVSSNSFIAEEVFGGSGRVVLLAPTITVYDLPDISNQREFESLEHAYAWLSSCESASVGHISQLLESDYHRFVSGAPRDNGPLTHWVGRTTHDLFDVELPDTRSSDLEHHLEVLRQALPEPLPRSINDLRYKYRNFEVLLPLLEKRFVKLLSSAL